jgi:hypothetical protein
MRVRVLVSSICLMATVASVLAQTPAAPQRATTPRPAPAAEQPATAAPNTAVAPTPPRRQGQPVNVRIDVTITDQKDGTAALKKTVSVVTADGMNSFIRSTANYSNIGDVPLNVDVMPELIADGKIRVGVNLQYDLPGGVAKPSTDTPGPATAVEVGWLRRTQIRENLAVILENGKSVTVAQSADPVGDRQVTIDVKATLLR